MNKGQTILATVIVVGFILLTITMAFFRSEIPEWVRDNFGLVVGAWIVNFTTIVNWLFGSSKGSADKTKIIAGQTENETTTMPDVRK